MNIAILASKLNIHGGGSNQSLRLLANMLSERGHAVTVLTINSEENVLPEDPSFRIAECSDVDGRTRAGKTLEVSRIIQSYTPTPDIFHLFSPLYLTAAGHARKHLDIPIVARLNTYNPFCVNTGRMTGSCFHNCHVRAKFRHQDAPLLKRLGKLPFYMSRTYVEPAYWDNLDGYFALSPAVRAIYETFGISAEKTHLIPNFFDPGFAEQDSDPMGRADDPFQLLYVGRLEPAKGIDLLLRAVGRVDDVNLTIVGEGNHRAQLRRMTSQIGIEERIAFTGRVSNDSLPALFSKADLFVHPARWPEPFGRTLLEALQMRTPCLVSDVGGPPWVVGEAGMTFRPTVVVDLAGGIRRLRDDESLVSRLAGRCQGELTRFQPESIVSEVENQYLEVCE